MGEHNGPFKVRGASQNREKIKCTPYPLPIEPGFFKTEKSNGSGSQQRKKSKSGDRPPPKMGKGTFQRAEAIRGCERNSFLHE